MRSQRWTWWPVWFHPCNLPLCNTRDKNKGILASVRSVWWGIPCRTFLKGFKYDVLVCQWRHTTVTILSHGDHQWWWWWIIDDSGDNWWDYPRNLLIKYKVVIKFCSKSNVDERGVTLIELCTAIQLIRIDILVQKYLTRENKKYTKL